MQEKMAILAGIVRKYKIVFRVSLIVFVAAVVLCIIEAFSIIVSSGGFRNALSISINNMGPVIGISGAVSVVYVIVRFLSMKYDSWEEKDETEVPKASADELKAVAAKLNSKKSSKN